MHGNRSIPPLTRSDFNFDLSFNLDLNLGPQRLNFLNYHNLTNVLSKELGSRSKPFLHNAIHSNTFLYIPIHSNTFLYIPIPFFQARSPKFCLVVDLNHSYTLLYIPIHSYKFQYISIHFYTFQYHFSS